MRIVATDIIITQLYSIALHNSQIIRKKFSNFPAGWGVISGRFSGEKFFSFGLPKTLSKSYFKNKTRNKKIKNKNNNFSLKICRRMLKSRKTIIQFLWMIFLFF